MLFGAHVNNGPKVCSWRRGHICDSNVQVRMRRLATTTSSSCFSICSPLRVPKMMPNVDVVLADAGCSVISKLRLSGSVHTHIYPRARIGKHILPTCKQHGRPLDEQRPGVFPCTFANRIAWGRDITTTCMKFNVVEGTRIGHATCDCHVASCRPGGCEQTRLDSCECTDQFRHGDAHMPSTMHCRTGTNTYIIISRRHLSGCLKPFC